MWRAVQRGFTIEEPRRGGVGGHRCPVRVPRDKAGYCSSGKQPMLQSTECRSDILRKAGLKLQDMQVESTGLVLAESGAVSITKTQHLQGTLLQLSA